MKKILALTLVAILLASCGAASVKTGLGHTISIAKSVDATADKVGTAQVDTVMAAVTFDATGKILGVRIDSSQVKVQFDANGKILTDRSSKPKTKVELGDDYGMKRGSKIGKEWYQEIASLEQWMVGKTVDQVLSLKVKHVDESHPAVPDTADLSSRVTVSVQDYQAAAAEALANAK
ncbi:MAG: hypothetical protein N2376_09925 [Clostridia bacterium]|nr:hypothetical protein [Clostridia bacterium]